MTKYILSILGIVIAGIFIDIIVPNGKINKYIKSIYSIFVVAVLLSPLINFLNKNHDFTVKYKDYELNTELINYIHSMRVKAMETNLENYLGAEGFKNIHIELTFSSKNNEISYNSCKISLKNLVIEKDKQHINKYEFIKEVVKENTNLSNEEIIFDEWKRNKNKTKMASKIKKH